jgi:membrane fusion protein (multidrug efflux system)
MRCAAIPARGARVERDRGHRSIALPAVCPLLVLAAVVALSGCGQGEPSAVDAGAEGEDRSKPVAVEAVILEPQPFDVEVALTGQLEAEFEVVVRSELEGIIRSIEFQEGQPVSKGDVMFVLRDEEQRARLHEAQAELRLAEDVYERTQSLTSRDISSVARRAEAAAMLDEARAKVELATVDLDRTRILAPFDGVVGSRLVGPGEWVQPETGLVPIAAIDRLQLHFLLPEPSIRLARIGGTVHARVIAYPDERFEGEVFFVSPSVDRATRRLLAKAWVSNEDHRLKPGMFANVDVVVFEKDAALLVPESAMVYDRHGTYVWRIDAEERAEKVPVEIGVRRHGKVEILGGLAAGDRVITAGVNKVMAGSLVSVQPAAPDLEGPDDAVHARRDRQSRSKLAPGVEG